MLIVLSPSKALDFTAPPVSAQLTTPELADHTRELSKTTKKLRSIDLKRLMDLSDDLAKLNRGASLYDFWADRVAASLNEAGQGHKDRVLVNCASQEYFGAVDVAALKMPVVTCRFLEAKDGDAKIISFYAKRARGLMARYAIDNRIDKAADLRGFDVAGYRFDKAA